MVLDRRRFGAPDNGADLKQIGSFGTGSAAAPNTIVWSESSHKIDSYSVPLAGVLVLLEVVARGKFV